MKKIHSNMRMLVDENRKSFSDPGGYYEDVEDVK